MHVGSSINIRIVPSNFPIGTELSIFNSFLQVSTQGSNIKTLCNSRLSVHSSNLLLLLVEFKKECEVVAIATVLICILCPKYTVENLAQQLNSDHIPLL